MYCEWVSSAQTLYINRTATTALFAPRVSDELSVTGEGTLFTYLLTTGPRLETYR